MLRLVPPNTSVSPVVFSLSIEPAVLPLRLHGEDRNSGWLMRGSDAALVDVSERMRRLQLVAGAGREVLPKGADRFAYVLVGGMSAGLSDGYLDSNLASLNERGLTAFRAGIDPAATASANAEAVKEAIVAAAQLREQVVVIAHSKGAVDVAAALAKDAALRHEVRAVVAASAPIGGSALVDALIAQPSLADQLGADVARLWSHRRAAMLELSTRARMAQVAELPLPTDVPWVCLTGAQRSLSSPLFSSQDHLARAGLMTDGVVAEQDAVVPGAYVAHVEAMDHLGFAVPGETLERPSILTRCAVALALELPPGRAMISRAAA